MRKQEKVCKEKKTSVAQACGIVEKKSSIAGPNNKRDMGTNVANMFSDPAKKQRLSAQNQGKETQNLRVLTEQIVILIAPYVLP